MTIARSNIPGVTPAQLNQIVQTIGGIPGGPRGFMAAVETWVGVINDLYGDASVPVLLSNESVARIAMGCKRCRGCRTKRISLQCTTVLL
jgi:hypothetical protein